MALCRISVFTRHVYEKPLHPLRYLFADGSTLVVDSGKALFLRENSSLNIDGAAVAITLSDDMQFHTSQFNVLNGASASVNLLNDNLHINQGASLNVDGGSTLTLTFGAGKYVKRVVGETSLTPKAAIKVTNNYISSSRWMKSG